MTRPFFRAPAEPAPEPLMSFGRMHATLKHIREELNRLPQPQNDYFGGLQTIRSAALALCAEIEKLITDYEEGMAPPPPAPVEVIHTHKLPKPDQPPAQEKRGRGRPSRTEPGPKPEPGEEGGHVTLRSRVLRLLKAGGPLSAAQIASKLGIESHSVSQQLWLAKKADQVEDEDGIWSVR